MKVGWNGPVYGKTVSGCGRKYRVWIHGDGFRVGNCPRPFFYESIGTLNRLYLYQSLRTGVRGNLTASEIVCLYRGIDVWASRGLDSLCLYTV